MASHVRQVQVVCPPPCAKASLVTDEDLASAELVTVRASRRWVGDPRSDGGPYELAHHVLPTSIAYIAPAGIGKSLGHNVCSS